MTGPHVYRRPRFNLKKISSGIIQDKISEYICMKNLTFFTKFYFTCRVNLIPCMYKCVDQM